MICRKAAGAAVALLGSAACLAQAAPPIQPEDYGWFPGSLSMSAAQATIDAALASGSAIQFGPGEYLVDYTGPARDVNGQPFYVNSVNGRALYATVEDASLTMLGDSEGGTLLKMASPEQDASILFAEHLDHLEIRRITFDGNQQQDVWGSGPVTSHGTRETYLFDNVFQNGSASKIGSSERRHAKLFMHGNNRYQDIHGAYAIGIKFWGVETVIETAPNIYLRAGGGATYDGDPIYYPGRPALSGIVANGTELTLTFATSHGYSAGDWLEVKGADDIHFNGRFQIQSVPSATTLVVEARVPPGSPVATGNIDSTKAWPPTKYIEIYQALTFDMASIGQVNGVKIEDGAEEVRINLIDSNVHLAGNLKATSIFIGAGQGNQGFGTIHIDNVRGFFLNDVVQIGLGSADIEEIDIGTIEGDLVGSLLRVDLINGQFLESHGVIKSLRIGSLEGDVVESPFNNRGSLIDIGSRFHPEHIIQELVIENSSARAPRRRPMTEPK